jgi:hypothetical protein
VYQTIQSNQNNLNLRNKVKKGRVEVGVRAMLIILTSQVTRSCNDFKSDMPMVNLNGLA